jgi:hypothetical protein
VNLAALDRALHASVRRVLRQAWELDDAAKAEKLIRNLAQRLERDAPGVSKSILEGLDEILTVSRLGLPAELLAKAANERVAAARKLLGEAQGSPVLVESVLKADAAPVEATFDNVDDMLKWLEDEK